MHLILQSPTNRRIDALLLSATPERMRVMVKNRKDTLEFTLVGSQWISDHGSAVEIEALMTDDPNAVARIWCEPHPRVTGAAS